MQYNIHFSVFHQISIKNYKNFISPASAKSFFAEYSRRDLIISEILGIIIKYQSLKSINSKGEFSMNRKVAEELLSLTAEQRQEIIENHKSNGVLIPVTDGVFIGKNVKLEKGTIVLQGSVLTGQTSVKEGSVIGPNTLLFDTTVEKNASLNSVQAFESEIGEEADLGPFVHIRPNSHIAARVHLGNFVEVKNSFIGEKTSVSHLTYVGDSDVGRNVNFGCGCVTVNFNGKEKSRTTVGDHAFIGCNTNLVAPVTIGAYGYTAAGSTITKDVPENALAIARARQENKEDWVKRKKPYRGME